MPVRRYSLFFKQWHEQALAKKGAEGQHEAFKAVELERKND